jgi:thioredoxin 1
MAGKGVLELTDGNFEGEVVKSDKPVLVDFWAEWCMPCRMLAPTIDELAEQYAGKIKVGKVDTDANRETATSYQINAIPTVILFKNGEIAQKFVGVTPKKQFEQAIDAVVG